jgi:hypothetical protein
VKNGEFLRNNTDVFQKPSAGMSGAKPTSWREFSLALLYGNHGWKLKETALPAFQEENPVRLINLMTIVFAMLLLAIIPALLQFGRMAGAPPSTTLATLGAIGFLVVMFIRRV